MSPRRRRKNKGEDAPAYDETKSLFAPQVDGRPAAEVALLVGVGLPADSHDATDRSLDELAELASTAGVRIAGRFIQRRTRIVGATYIGRGKLEELAEALENSKAGLVIFDNDLSPAQARNIEAVLRVKVIDRSELILDIFAIHARTETAKVQVELAQLEYAIPRLRRLWNHLSRLGGGIGTRGPGETQLEVDRRKVRDRITRLKKHLDKLETSRTIQRRARREGVTASLVGYTNAGKSTLLNALAGSDAYVANELFATLDTTSRAVDLGKDYRIVLSDTVGFIRKLPHKLVESFRATLSEVAESDLLIHVVDASSPDAEMQIETVNGVLEELNAHTKPTVLVLNKVDQVEDLLVLNELMTGHGPGVVVSALTGKGIKELREIMRSEVSNRYRVVDMELEAAESAGVAEIHRAGEVLEKEYENGKVQIRARLPVEWVERFRSRGWIARGDR